MQPEVEDDEDEHHEAGRRPGAPRTCAQRSRRADGQRRQAAGARQGDRAEGQARGLNEADMVKGRLHASAGMTAKILASEHAGRNFAPGVYADIQGQQRRMYRMTGARASEHPEIARHYGLNFQPVEFVDAKGELRPMFRMTAKGLSELAMSFSDLARVTGALLRPLSTPCPEETTKAC